MKKFSTMVFVAALGVGVAFAADVNSSSEGMMGNMSGMMGMMRAMQTMDAGGDGMLSKDEFMKSHAAMFDAMEKNKEGLVDMRRLPCA